MTIDNAIYDRLGDRWYDADDDPVALLRAEAKLRNPWVARRIEREFPSANVLDIGCGAGFLSNMLAKAGHRVTGLDASVEALAVAKRHDATKSVDYREGDARALPFAPASFDVVAAMDFLEHVDNPAVVIAEVSRVLAPGGLFFFHTFNRNPIAWLVVIKGVEWFVANTPKHLHVLDLFVKPSELSKACERYGMTIEEMIGVRPRIDGAFFRMLGTRTVPHGFSFVHTKSLMCGYSGIARKVTELRA